MSHWSWDSEIDDHRSARLRVRVSSRPFVYVHVISASISASISAFLLEDNLDDFARKRDMIPCYYT